VVDPDAAGDVVHGEPGQHHPSSRICIMLGTATYPASGSMKIVIVIVVG
jgi:hypothetical protein